MRFGRRVRSIADAPHLIVRSEAGHEINFRVGKGLRPMTAFADAEDPGRLRVSPRRSSRRSGGHRAWDGVGSLLNVSVPSVPVVGLPAVRYG
jgi:hypothetical protein